MNLPKPSRILAAVVAVLLSMNGACADLGVESKTSARMFSLALASGGSGTGTLVATPAATSYAEGTTVSIAATAAGGSVFTGWSGDCTTPANPCSLVMTADRAVTGTFTPSSGAGRFDGAWTGTWSGGQSTGATLNGTLTFAVSNGAIAGTLAPISGSVGTFGGAISAGGDITATIASGLNGCAVTLTGVAATSTASGITGATASGAYRLVPSSTCNTNTGAWRAVRK